MKLAPIVLFTFNRLEHTKKTIEALKNNYLASESRLIIYSDAARNETEKIKVQQVREYLHKVDGFKEIEVIEAEENKGLAKSVIEGVTNVIDQYDKVIVLEDDLITSKFFLEYMNEALNLYKSRGDIWSISGYTANIGIPDDYKEDIYLVKRGASWGWATWKDRWITNDWEIKDYKDFKRSKILRKKFGQAGTDMIYMLDDQMSGRINSWAIRWCYNQFKQDKWTIYPTKSMVKNIGNDLSGTHTPITNKYDVMLIDNGLILKKDIKLNKEILKNFKTFYDLNCLKYINVLIKKIGLYKQMRNIRNIIVRFLK